MSWAEPAADMDTLGELPPSSVSVGKVSNLSRGSSKSARRVGGASKSERRLLMEAKAGVGAAIAEVRAIRSDEVMSAGRPAAPDRSGG